MICVTGATGQLGRLVIEELLKSVPAGQIVAAVRRPAAARDLEEQGIVVREADYAQPGHWPLALAGVQKVLLISSPDVGERLAQHKNVIDAVRDSASVRLLAYTSMLRADTARVPYASEDRLTEALIAASGVPYVFLRHGWYTENYTMHALSSAQEGALHGCAGKGRISGAARADYAAAAAAVLTAYAGCKPVYELAGDSSFSLEELVQEIARQTGKAVRYVDMSEPDYRALLTSHGFPPAVAATLASADTGAAHGDVLGDSRDLSELIGRPTTSLQSLVAAALAGGKGDA